MVKGNLNQKRHLAIDIGTSKTRIYIDNLGIIYNEATLIALDYKTKKIVAVGDEAKKFVGKLSGTLQLKYPMKKGVISDMALLKLFLSNILKKYKEEIKDSIVTLACPTSLTEVERNSLIKAIKELGVYFVSVEDDIKLALLGAGVDITKSAGRLCLDIGAGKATAAIISSNETITSKWSKAAGNVIDSEIIKFLKAKKQILVGDITAEQIKNTISSLTKTKNPLKMMAYGYDLNSGMPRNVELSDKDISKLILAAFSNLTNLITSVLEESPNELAGDVIKNGLYITGGMGNTHGIKFFFEDFFEIPANIVRNFATATIDGAIAHKNLTIKKIEDSNEKISDW